MSTVQETASLDEKSVQAVAAGEVKVHRRPRRKAEPKSSPVHTVNVDERILATLVEMGLSVGSRRVQVVSPTEVIVWNPGVKWADR